MITDIEKDTIFKSIIPFGLFYKSKNHSKQIEDKLYKLDKNNFESKEDFIDAVKSLLHSNNLHFVSSIKRKDTKEFISTINVQFNLYDVEHPNNIFSWLEHTKDLIVNGKGLVFTEVDNLENKSAFIDWYNEKIKPINEARDNRIKQFHKIEREMRPFGLYYNTPDIYILEAPETENECIRLIEISHKKNDAEFLRQILNLSETDFVKRLSIEYSNYNRQGGDMAKWLNHTFNLLKRNLQNPTLFYAFEQWLKVNNYEINYSEKTVENRIDNNNLQVEKIDYNLWNEKGKSIFEYLIENYNGAKGKQKFINVYHFLRNVDNHIRQADIKFFYGEATYKEFINSKYEITLTKLNKPYNYQTQLMKLDEWYNRWLISSKAI